MMSISLDRLRICTHLKKVTGMQPKNDGAPHAGAVLCIAGRAHAEDGAPHVLLCLLQQA